MLAVGHDDGALHAVLQLAHVAGPGVCLDRGGRVREQRQVAALVLLGVLAHEGVGEQRGVALSAAKRRDLDDDFGEAVVEVLAEPALRDHGAQVLVGGAHHAHVDRDLLAAAQALDDAVLQEAQDLRLQRRRQVADLVEKERAAVRELDLAGVCFTAPVKAPFS